MSMQSPEPARISRIHLPERKAEIGMSLREGERLLELNTAKHQDLVDLTYADTKRFPALCFPRAFGHRFHEHSATRSTVIRPPIPR